MRTFVNKALKIIVVAAILLNFSFKPNSAIAVGPWTMFFQKAVEEILGKMFREALGLKDPFREFKIEKAKAAFERVHNEQIGKLKKRHEAEWSRLEEEFNKKWSRQYSSGTTKERMEEAKRAKQEEEEVFRNLKERHRKEEQELEDAYRWVLDKYVYSSYRNYQEKLEDPGYL